MSPVCSKSSNSVLLKQQGPPLTICSGWGPLDAFLPPPVGIAGSFGRPTRFGEGRQGGAQEPWPAHNADIALGVCVPVPPSAWRLPPPLPAPADEAPIPGLPAELWAVFARRGQADPAALAGLLDPPDPPDPFSHFPDLERAVGRLAEAARRGEAVAICGDYDADGMTSTALLTGLLQKLGGDPSPPSRAGKRRATV